MTDLLLVHDLGHGSWFWGPVWGYLTAPVEHPPSLSARRSLGNVVVMDLPGHVAGVGGNSSSLSFDDFVNAVTAEVEGQHLKDVVLAGHGLVAPVILQAAAKLNVPPKRIVVFAGVIPGEGKRVLDMLPRPARLAFNLMVQLNSLARKEIKLPRAAISSIYCNGMDPFMMVPVLGRFNPLPVEVFRTRVYLSDLSGVCPVTYVPLRRDRLIPSEHQSRMAAALDSVEIIDGLDSCHEVMIERPGKVAEILRRYI